MVFEIYLINCRLGYVGEERIIAICDALEDAIAIKKALGGRYAHPICYRMRMEQPRSRRRPKKSEEG